MMKNLIMLAVMTISVCSPGAFALRCKDVTFSADLVTVTATDTADTTHAPRYKFELPFSAECGHYSSSSTIFPVQSAVQKLIDEYFAGKIISPITFISNTEQAAQTFTVKQSLFDGGFVYEEKISLAHDHNYPHMTNSSILKNIISAQAPYSAIKSIAWSDNCIQESAGFCFAWDAAFSITLELVDGQTLKQARAQALTLMPIIFNQTYLSYARFLATAAP